MNSKRAELFKSSLLLFILSSASLSIFISNANAAAPTASTGVAGGISSAGSASVVGSVSASESTTVYFDYGTTTAYGTTVTAGTVTTTELVSATLTSLTCGTTYHYRIRAVSASGTSSGYDSTFVACKSTTYGDFNGDGTTDILWRHSFSGQNYIALMNGTTKIGGSPLPRITNPYWQIVGLADFNADGMSDIFWRNIHTGTNNIWYMNGMTKSGGAGVTQIPYPASVSFIQPWRFDALGDFNGDGSPDIYWSCSYNNGAPTTEVWLMNGATKVSGFAPICSGANCGSDSGWSGVSGDFDGNGFTDIVWHNSVNGKNYIQWAHEILAQDFGWGNLSANSSNWTIAGVGKFNGDQTEEILWRDSSTGALYLWSIEMDYAHTASTYVQSTVASSVSLNWEIVRVGDFNGDAFTDILWRDSSTGQHSIWLMKGATQIGGGAIDSGTSAYWRVAP